MVDAIEPATTLAAQRERLRKEAQATTEETLASGEGYDAFEVYTHLAARDVPVRATTRAAEVVSPAVRPDAPPLEIASFQPNL